MAGLPPPPSLSPLPLPLQKVCNHDEVISAQLPWAFECVRKLSKFSLLFMLIAKAFRLTNCSQILSMLTPSLSRSSSLSPSHLIYLLPFTFLCAWNSRFLWFISHANCDWLWWQKVKGEFMGHMTSSAVVVVFIIIIIIIVIMKLNIIINTVKQLQTLKLWHSTAKNTFEQSTRWTQQTRKVLIRMQRREGHVRLSVT